MAKRRKRNEPRGSLLVSKRHRNSHDDHAGMSAGTLGPNVCKSIVCFSTCFLSIRPNLHVQPYTSKLHTFCAKQKQYLEQTAIAIRVLFSSQNRNAITNLLLLFCLQICLLLKNKAPTKTHFTATLEARKKVRYTPVLLPSLIQLCLKA